MLHWLLHEMGAKDLVWRKGGTGAGAPDQGRDLEATFHVPGPTGDIDVQRWWIEAKGRSRTVEPAVVKEAVLNAAGRSDVDVVVIATNSQFSNPTRDWVTEWQRGTPMPRVQLWDRTSLERMVSKHPAVAARLFPRALTPQGYLEFAEGRFWNQLVLADQEALQRLWAARADLKITAPAMFALVAGERSNGLSCRPWLADVDRDDVLEVLGIAIQNALYLLKTSSDRGSSFDPVAHALEHTIASALLQVPAAELASYIEDVLQARGFPGDLAFFQEHMLGPLLNGLAADMFEACVCDCARVSKMSDPERTPASSFWALFIASPAATPKKDERFLLLIGHEKPCKMGFALTKEDTCPLHDFDGKKAELRKSLSTLERVLRQRVEATQHEQQG